MKDNHLQTWLEKPQHGYLFRIRKDTNRVKESATHLWLKKFPFLGMSKDTYMLSMKKKFSQDLLKQNFQLTNKSVRTADYVVTPQKPFNTLLMHDRI